LQIDEEEEEKRLNFFLRSFKGDWVC